MADDYCYLTTIGRRTGSPHRIEIWYARERDTLYLLSGGGRRADWVRNLEADAVVTVEVDGVTHQATARIIDGDSDESQSARQLVFDKYESRYGGDLTGWRNEALPVALDLGNEAP